MPDILNNVPGSNDAQSNSNNQVLDNLIGIRRSVESTQTNVSQGIDLLKSIDKNIQNMSVASARQSTPNRGRYGRDGGGNYSFRNPFGRSSSWRSSGVSSDFKRMFDEFDDAFTKGLLDAFGASDFKRKINNAFSNLADDLGVSIEDIPRTLGQQLSRQFVDKFKSSELGSILYNKYQNIVNSLFGNIDDAYRRGSGVKRGLFDEIPNARASYSNNKAFETSKDSSLNLNSISISGDVTIAGALRIGSLQIGTEIPSDKFSNIKDIGLNSTDAAEFIGQDLISSEIPIDPNALGLDSVTGMGEAAAGVSEILGTVAPELLVIQLGLKVFSATLSWASEDLKAGWEELKKATKKAAMRDFESRKANIKSERDRIKADVETLVKEPFEILKKAAEEVYDVWDNQLRIINATQGYSKAGLQDLMAVYAQRIRDEGLSSVVSSTEITESLAKVLESGLSGKVAEEFAFIATKLNAAIPTQDFFNYAETYASLAANAIATGKSQADAIEYANQQLELFASNALYASRELAGGFSTGLKDASDLFTKSVQITQAAKAGTPSEISGVLTAVAGITGALAPDLASSMVDAIVGAATGGNSSEIVALRSLAGINASNTEFLRQLALNPQKVFGTLFTNLSSMQKMSNDAFMEVAEGLSSVFGISMDAFARLDFQQLADVINEMSISDGSLNANVQQLISGQTTANAEQLKIQQINQYVIEEGLSYVVDNAAARMIQEHMWDEQIAREIQETTYGTEIKGAALEVLNGIYSFLEKVYMVLNPIYGLTKLISNVASSIEDAIEQRNMVEDAIAVGNVGRANAVIYKNLTTTGASLNLTQDYVSQLSKLTGITAPNVQALNALRENWNYNTNPFGAIYNQNTNSLSGGGNAAALSTFLKDSLKSRYRWGTISKSDASFFQAALSLTNKVGVQTTPYFTTNNTATELAKKGLANKISTMLTDEYMRPFLEEGGYGAWEKSAANLGITNLSEALESAGYNESDIRNKFEAQQAQEAARDKQKREKLEETFWDKSMSHMEYIKTQFIPTDLIQDYFTPALSTADSIHSELIENGKLYSLVSSIKDRLGNSGVLYTTLNAFKTEWTKYFVEHAVYKKSYDIEAVNQALNDKKTSSEDAIYTLVDALTNPKSLDDPQLQTNVLLAQIIKLVQVIITQQEGSSISLPGILSLTSAAYGGSGGGGMTNMVK